MATHHQDLIPDFATLSLFLYEIDMKIKKTLLSARAGAEGLLGLGQYVQRHRRGSSADRRGAGLMPAALFAIAAIFAFTTGASWGAIGILVPIGMTVAASMSPTLAVLTLAATLSGSVMGDHCSPISDTTILSSTGVQCKHVNHVMTQIPYALVAGGFSLVLYLPSYTTCTVDNLRCVVVQCFLSGVK